MSRGSSSTINYTLTSYAQGLANDTVKAIELVNALMPTIVVSGASGQYKKFDDKNSFTAYATLRGLGSTARRIEFGATDDTFVCKPNALEVTVDDYERQLAGTGNTVANQLLDEGKIRALVNARVVSDCVDAVAFVAANTTAVSSRGNWSNADVDPIDQIDEQLQNLMTNTGGFMVPQVILGLSAWRTLRNHPKVKARCSGVQVGSITLDQLQGMFFIPAKPIVGMVSYNTVNHAQTASKSQVLGDLCYITASVPNPTIYDPSPFKRFVTGPGGVEAVRTYRSEANRSDIHAVDWTSVFKSTSTQSIIRLTIT